MWKIGERTRRTALRTGRRALVGSLVVGAGFLAVPAAASAAPTKAPSGLMGQFFDCSNGQSGNFVVNSGNSNAPTTWNVAHLAFASGGTGIFVPTQLHLMFTMGDMTFTQDATKGSAPSSVTCSITASGPGFSLSGMVVGNMVTTG